MLSMAGTRSAAGLKTRRGADDLGGSGTRSLARRGVDDLGGSGARSSAVAVLEIVVAADGIYREG